MFFQSVRSRTSPWFEVLIAVLSGMIIQVPHMIRTQVTDPSCWTPHQDIPNTINLTVFCPCNFDGNDVIPSCVESNDCPYIVLGKFIYLFSLNFLERCTNIQPEEFGKFLFLDKYMCIYELEEVLARTQTSIWKLYVILCEILVRFGPCALLIVLNLLMIRDFNKSHNRRASLGLDLLGSSPPMSRKRKVTINSNVQSWGGDNQPESIESISNAFSIDAQKKDTFEENNNGPPPIVINVCFKIMIEYKYCNLVKCL